MLSSKFAIVKFFSVCIARSTAPVPVCILGVLYSVSIISCCKILCILSIQTPPLSVCIFSGNQYRLKFCFKKFSTSLVFDDLQIFAVDHLLNLSIAINIWYSPFNFLLFKLPEKSIWISCPGSVNVFSFPNSFFGNWYFKFLSDDMQATQFFALSSISFCMFGHQKILASAVFLVAPACPKCRVSSSFFRSSVGTIIRSSLNVNPLLLFSFSNVVRYWSGAMFFSPRLNASRTQLSSASVEDFA